MDVHEGGAVAHESVDVHRLGEHVGAVERRRDVLDLDDLERLELAHFEVAPIDVPRAMARLAVARELDGAGVVDAQDSRGVLVESHLGQQGANECHLAGARAGGDDLGLGRRQRDARLALARVHNGDAAARSRQKPVVEWPTDQSESLSAMRVPAFSASPSMIMASSAVCAMYSITLSARASSSGVGKVSARARSATLCAMSTRAQGEA